MLTFLGIFIIFINIFFSFYGFLIIAVFLTLSAVEVVIGLSLVLLYEQTRFI